MRSRDAPGALGVDAVSALRRVLLREAPFGAVRLRRLEVQLEPRDRRSGLDDGRWQTLAEEVGAQRGLEALSVGALACSLPRLAPDALRAGALAAGVRDLALEGIQLCTPHAEALTRLLSDGAPRLTELSLTMIYTIPLPARVMAPLLHGVRRNATLTSLPLKWHNNLPVQVDTTLQLLDVLIGHPVLSKLQLVDEAKFTKTALTGRAFGQALGALLAAPRCALTRLEVFKFWVDTDLLAPLAAGLHANTRLQHLVLRTSQVFDDPMRGVIGPALPDDTVVLPEFVAATVLPAVRACATLRSAELRGHWCRFIAGGGAARAHQIPQTATAEHAWAARDAPSGARTSQDTRRPAGCGGCGARAGRRAYNEVCSPAAASRQRRRRTLDGDSAVRSNANNYITCAHS
jgi:hypothetical protein